jgi:hypothetical protein
VPYGLRAQVLAFEGELAGGPVLPPLPGVVEAEWEPVDEEQA